jgi:FADH2 O2-dependent halogenase
MRIDADVAVIGSGFAGSLTALCLQRMGRRVVMVERGRHPRFAIGESSTPLANLLLEELARRYDLPRVGVFSKWGTWQRSRPDVAGGLKRGFSFYFHVPGEAFADDGEHARQLLVAASPHDDIGDTHWYRPDFDYNLVREAADAGVSYLDGTELTGISFSADGAVIDGARQGQHVAIRASFVVDASGPRGFLARALRLDAPLLAWLPPTQGLYTHFENVGHWERLVPAPGAPYPPDAAALHHVFPGGWIWILRFANGINGAGTVSRRLRRPPMDSRATPRLPRATGLRARLGAAAFGGRRHRPAPLNRFSPDSARHRAAGRHPGTDDGWSRTRRRSAPLRRGDHQ